MSEYGQAMALAILSLALLVGWFWLKGKWVVKAGTRWRANEQWLNSAARFFYGVGLPYLAIISGVLPPRFLGLKGLENFVLIHLTGDFLADLQKAVMVVLLEAVVDARVMFGVGLVGLLILMAIRLGVAQLGLELGAGYSMSVLDTIYDGLHWAFYRAIFWLITGDLYLGVVLSIAWLLLEWTLLAWIQKNWPAQQHHFLTNTIILIVTSTIFFYSPNLWLLWPVHLTLVATITLPLQRDMAGGLS